MTRPLRVFLLLSFMLPLTFYGQQLENPGFENWENIGSGYIEPFDWSTIKTSDDTVISTLAPLTYDRSDDAHTGNYSLKLYNVQVFANLVATGAITNGRFHAEFDLAASYSFTQQDDPRWNTVFTARPDSLVGWFKFIPKGDDYAQFKVILHVDSCQLPENGTMDNWVGMAVNVTERGDTIDTWTRFSVPFVYFNDSTPEFVLTVINSGDSTTANADSYLLVDDLQLIYGPAGISNPGIPESFLINGDGRLIIRLDPAEEYIHRWFYLYDVTGHTILSKQLDNEQVILPAGLTQGIYVAVLDGRNRRFVQKIMIR
jgi:hypothetical protein